MTEVNSAVTLKLSAVEGVTLKQAEKLLKKMLRESTIRQNAAIKANLAVDCTDFTKFSSASARALSLPIPRSKVRLAASRVDEMDRSEAYRVLGGYQKRLALAQFLRSTKWLASFEECKSARNWIDYNLYKNVLRARKLPTVPRVKSGIIPLAKSDTSFCVLSHTEGSVTLERFALWDRRANLIFKLPSKLALLHPNLKKIARPNIRLLNGEVVFDFVLRETVEREMITSVSTLALDLGITKVFSAARVYSDGRYSEELTPSMFTDRQSKTAEKLSREIALVSAKNCRRSVLGLQNKHSIAQETTLREKRKRINEAHDWSAAADILAHSKAGEQITIENLKFNSGASLGEKRFRHGSVSGKLEHAANRRGKNVKRVSASFSSQICPRCQTKNAPDSDRVIRCNCGWSADRDYTAAIILGQRGLKIKKLSVKKNRPTPKRPRQTARKCAVLPFKNRAWTAFTGATPAEATGKFIELSATSVTGGLPVSCPSNFAA